MSLPLNLDPGQPQVIRVAITICNAELQEMRILTLEMTKLRKRRPMSHNRALRRLVR
jgi:hypothetical protein